MDYRALGGTGLQVSALGFGCGAVGGILVKGTHDEQTRAVARAVELGVNYFDTAAIYGDGQSETNLGRVLRELRAPVIVGTKVQLQPSDMEQIERAVVASVDNSLRRLQRDYVDLIQLHNFLGDTRDAQRRWVTVEDFARALEAFDLLKRQGKVGFVGFNGLGDPAAVLQAVERDVNSIPINSVQTCFNLLNPTAGIPAPPGFPFEDYGQLIDRAAARQVGVIAIRVLAGGALSGSAARHANAAQSVEPIASGHSFDADVALAQRFAFLVDEGFVESLPEAAVRFAMDKTGVATALVGISTLEQLEQAATYAERGPLPEEALARLPTVWAAMAG